MESVVKAPTRKDEVDNEYEDVMRGNNRKLYDLRSYRLLCKLKLARDF